MGATSFDVEPLNVHPCIYDLQLPQAVRIPAELAYTRWDTDLVIERNGDELRIRPARRRMGDVLGKLARFSPDFLAAGRGVNPEGKREAL